MGELRRSHLTHREGETAYRVVKMGSECSVEAHGSFGGCIAQDTHQCETQLIGRGGPAGAVAKTESHDAASGMDAVLTLGRGEVRGEETFREEFK